MTCCEEFSKHSGLRELNPFRGPVSVVQVVLNVIHTRYTLCSLTFQLIFDHLFRQSERGSRAYLRLLIRRRFSK